MRGSAREQPAGTAARGRIDPWWAVLAFVVAFAGWPRVWRPLWPSEWLMYGTGLALGVVTALVPRCRPLGIGWTAGIAANAVFVIVVLSPWMTGR